SEMQIAGCVANERIVSVAHPLSRSRGRESVRHAHSRWPMQPRYGATIGRSVAINARSLKSDNKNPKLSAACARRLVAVLAQYDGHHVRSHLLPGGGFIASAKGYSMP